MLELLGRVAKRPVVLWAVFLVVHGWLGFVGLAYPTHPFGDVTVQYKTWVLEALTGNVVGITEPWVYPLLALVPMTAAMVLGPGLYGVGWVLVVTITDAFVLAFLLSQGRPGSGVARRRLGAAWWWLLFILLLGPIALGRIDVMTVAIAIIALLLAQAKPAVAGVLLAVGAWIKVWPAALVAAVVLAVRRRWTAAVSAAIAAVVIGVVVLLLGSGANALGFISQQSVRGLQVEAPVSTFWMWFAYLDPSRGSAEYIHAINTFQVAGPGSAAASAVMTPLLVIVVAGVLLLALGVVRSGAGAERVLAPLSLAVVTGLIVMNKVGSPQFELWLAAPVVLGLASGAARFKAVAVIVGAIAALTQIIYPFGYDELLRLNPVMLTVLSARNLLLVAAFVFAIVLLWQARRVAVPTFALAEKTGA